MRQKIFWRSAVVSFTLLLASAATASTFDGSWWRSANRDSFTRRGLRGAMRTHLGAVTSFLYGDVAVPKKGEEEADRFFEALAKAERGVTALWEMKSEREGPDDAESPFELDNYYAGEPKPSHFDQGLVRRFVAKFPDLEEDLERLFSMEAVLALDDTHALRAALLEIYETHHPGDCLHAILGL